MTDLGSIYAAGGVALVLAACSALFSALETALFSIQPVHLDRLRRTNAPAAEEIGQLLQNPRRTLGGLLLADVFVNVPLILLCLILLGRTTSGILPFWASSAAVFAVVVLLCDLGPKLVALQAPIRVACSGLSVLRIILPPTDRIAKLIHEWSEALADRCTPAHMQTKRYLGEEEMEALVQMGTEQGALLESESEMIREILKLADKTAKDCMTPRTEMFSLPDDLEQEDARRRLREKRFRRVPVHGDTPDDILGILDVREWLQNPAQPYMECLVPPSFVSETMKALDLLKSFLVHPQRIAVVVDEFGGIEGIVTFSDIVEEVIADAVPIGGTDLYIEVLGDGRLLASGSSRLDDLSEYGIELHTDGIDTLGGWIFNRLGFLPPPGTEIDIEGRTATVRRVVRKRIAEVMISAPRIEENPE